MKGTENHKASRGVTCIDISKLKPFFKHVFDVRDDNQMQELSESIKSNGVIEPIIVRPSCKHIMDKMQREMPTMQWLL